MFSQLSKLSSIIKVTIFYDQSILKYISIYNKTKNLSYPIDIVAQKPENNIITFEVLYLNTNNAILKCVRKSNFKVSIVTFKDRVEYFLSFAGVLNESVYNKNTYTNNGSKIILITVNILGSILDLKEKFLTIYLLPT